MTLLFNHVFTHKFFLFQNGRTEITEVLPKFLSELSSSESDVSSESTAVSPMPGICDKILVKPGDQVEAKQPVAVIIAMKMEYVLKAPRDGIVKSVNADVGQSVAKGAVIIEFEQEEEVKPANPEKE